MSVSIIVDNYIVATSSTVDLSLYTDAIKNSSYNYIQVVFTTKQNVSSRFSNTNYQASITINGTSNSISVNGNDYFRYLRIIFDSNNNNYYIVNNNSYTFTINDTVSISFSLPDATTTNNTITGLSTDFTNCSMLPNSTRIYTSKVTRILTPNANCSFSSKDVVAVEVNNNSTTNFTTYLYRNTVINDYIADTIGFYLLGTNFSYVDSLKITANANATAASYNITLNIANITNCDISPSTTSFEYNGTDDYIITITPITNYIFDNTPTLIYNNNTYNFTVDNNAATINLNTLNISANSTLAINATASPPAELDIDTSELQFATVSPTTWKTTASIENNITVTPNENYVFSSSPTLTIKYDSNGSVSFYGSLNDDLSYSFSVTNEDIVIGVSLIGSATYVAPTTDSIDIDASNMSNVSFTDASSKVFFTSLYSKNSYRIKVNDGFIINGTPYLSIGRADSTKTTENFSYDSVNNEWYITDLVNYYSNVISAAIYANAILETVLLSDYQFIKVYKTDSNIINALKQVRFYNVTTTEYEDLGQYILNFIRYPFFIPPAENDNVILGFYKSSISSPTIENQIYTLSLGSHLINGIFKNENDVNACSIKANLKYYGILDIDSKYINTNIEIKYVTDILSNNTSIEVYSNDILINRVTCSIGFDIPYILETDKPKSYNDFSNNVKTLENIESVIIVEQNKNASNNFNSNKYVSLNDLTGYNEIEKLEIEMTSQMTLNEIEQIKTQLQNGVIF